jgi:lipoprotein NlpD
MGGCADTARTNRDDYVVRPQDTLYSIAWRYGLDFHDLARWNHIGPDFKITVGQALTLAPSGTAESGGAPSTTHTAPRVTKNLPHPPTTAPQSAAVPSALTWVWPTDRMSSPQPVQGGGILLMGQVGQDIRAASSGRVVYNGSGIRGYGSLIIIKHGENLLSAYAHNRESLVHDGQEVAGGQLIGHMGEGAPQKPVLYFEIRRNGKPVDPLAFLPKTK